jgi:thiamine biosynthesis lipoprotein
LRLYTVLVLLLIKAATAEDKFSSFEAVEPHMGTLIHITVHARNQQTAAIAFRAAFGRIHQLDEILSDYKPDSELNTICRTAVGQSIKVSEDLFRVLAASQQIAVESGGAFDVTLGPVIRLWRTARSQHQLPTPESLQQAGIRCGYRKLHLNDKDRSVLLDEAGMQLDLGGIAKGYAADEALAVIKAHGIHSALVAASGDLAFSDAPPGTRGWKIGLPSSEVLELSDAAVSTSGDTEQHLETTGKRYSHVIDPVTNMGVTSGIVVTVVARRCIESDALSTAISVLGPEQGDNLLSKYPRGTCYSLSPTPTPFSLTARSCRPVAPPRPSIVPPPRGSSTR